MTGLLPLPHAGEGRGDGPKPAQPLLTRRTLLTLSLLAACAPTQAACPRTRIATLRLRFVESYAIVEAELAGHPVTFIVDTGAQGMLVTPAIAAALNLPAAGETRIYGTGGSQPAHVVALPGLRLGGALMPPQLAPVAPFPLQLATDPPLAGLLGTSLLARFDLEFDVPAARLTLWSPAPCPPPGSGTAIPIEVSPAGEVFLPVRIEGQPLLAVLDTGSRSTILASPAARRLGLSAPTSANTGAGIDGTRLPIAHTHARLALGAEPGETVPIDIAPLQLDRGDLLLGLDQLARRPFWIAFDAAQATFAPS